MVTVTKHILGIDPGLTGGIVLLSTERKIIEKWVTPTMEIKKIKRGKKAVSNIVDIEAFHSILNSIKKNVYHCFLEKVGAMPGQGVVSMFNFGRTFGVTESLLVANRIPYTLVHPATWSKEIHGKLAGNDPKIKSKAIIQDLYPHENLLASPRSKIPHLGLVDALLISEYGLRVFESDPLLR